MGEYQPRSRMDQAGDQPQAPEDDFARTSKEGLIRSYAKGLLAFGSARWNTQGVEAHRRAPRRLRHELVYGGADRVYTIRYQMGQYKDGGCLRNLIIETTTWESLSQPVQCAGQRCR